MNTLINAINAWGFLFTSKLTMLYSVLLILLMITCLLAAVSFALKTRQQRATLNYLPNDRQVKQLQRYCHRSKVAFAVSLSVLLLYALCICVINSLFLPFVVQSTVSELASDLNVTVSFRQAEGSILSGEFQFNDVVIATLAQSEPADTIKLAKLAFKIQPWQWAFRRQLNIQSMHLEHVDYLASLEPKLSQKLTLYALKIQTLALDDVKLTLVQPQGKTISASIDNLKSNGYEGQAPLFSLLFKSTVRATLGDGTIAINRHDDQRTQTVYWSLHDLPSAIFKSTLSVSLFQHMRDATLSLEAQHRFQADGSLATDWKINSNKLNFDDKPVWAEGVDLKYLAMKNYFQEKAMHWVFNTTMHNPLLKQSFSELFAKDFEASFEKLLYQKAIRAEEGA